MLQHLIILVRALGTAQLNSAWNIFFKSENGKIVGCAYVYFRWNCISY